MTSAKSFPFSTYLGLDFKCSRRQKNRTSIVIWVKGIVYWRTETRVVHLLKEAARH
jgi:hypothetical protein